ncbi:MAG TPA: GrpB family protein [Methanothermobacter sp.]|nr:GrpB family protein [Methanothermobacter sp.]
MPEKVFVEHIGSSFIPGLISKPIIDIMIGVKDEN